MTQLYEDSLREVPRRTLPEQPEELTERFLAQDPIILAPLRLLAEAVGREPQTGSVKPQALVIGGFVRDAVLGAKPKDADVEVYGLEPTRVLELAETVFSGQAKKVGKAFEILKLEIEGGFELDISLPRKDSRAENISFEGGDATIDIKEAARLRDFTMNNLAADPLSGTVYDFWGGIKDLNQGLLRVTYPELFQTNPINVYRAMQFSARFLLEPEPKSVAVMQRMVQSGALEKVHGQRITEEFDKLLLKGLQPAIGLSILSRLGVLARHFPELEALRSTAAEFQGESYWSLMLRSVDLGAELMRGEVKFFTRDRFSFMLALVCYGLGTTRGEPTKKDSKASYISQDLEQRTETPAWTLLNKLQVGAIITAAVMTSVLSISRFRDLHQQYQSAEEELFGEKKPSAKPSRFLPPKKKSNVLEKQVQAAYQSLIDDLYPSSWEVGTSLFQVLAGVESATRELPPEVIFFKRILKQCSLDTQTRKTLLDAGDILTRFTLTRGPHIGWLIGAVEKRRYELITKRNALVYLEKNLDRLLKEAQEAEGQAPDGSE